MEDVKKLSVNWAAANNAAKCAATAAKCAANTAKCAATAAKCAANTAKCAATAAKCAATPAKCAATIDPLLNPLADNGGPTQTQALQPGSPAINGGDPAFVLTSGPFIAPPFYDQRGISPFNPVSGGIIDIGAFEFPRVP